MYLTQGLHRAVQRHPHKTALRHVAEDSERSLDFAELLDTVARHAAALQARGIQAGDRVALLAPNSDRLIVALWACWWLGAVVPKRHARRAVTRSLLKRQIRAAVERHAGGLPAGLWVVRLRAPFDRHTNRSAASQALRDAARAELDGVLARAGR